MDYGTWLVIVIIQFLIDISNILLNIFIIYALRKLNKLSNISYWFIFFLSMSDCFVGFSGIIAGMCYASCALGQDCTSLVYAIEVMTFFLSYSARLTTIIAMDRSIRMKYLNRYNSIMTKKKANVILMFNTAIGLIQFVGSLSSLKDIFEVSFNVFHFVCIISSCIFYLFTYFRVKKRVVNLHLNSPKICNRPHTDIEMSPNVVPHMSTEPNRHDNTYKSMLIGDNQRNEEYHSTGTGTLPSKNAEKGTIERYDLCIFNRDATISNFCRNCREETSTANNIPGDGDKNLLGAYNNLVFCGHSNNCAAMQNTVANLKNTAMNLDSKEANRRKRYDSDIGRAMPFIIMAIMVCYMVTFVHNILSIWKVASNNIVEAIGFNLMTAYSSVNAIILIVFGIEIRNVAKSML